MKGFTTVWVQKIYNQLFLKSLHDPHLHPAGLLLLLLSCPLEREKCSLWRMKCLASCMDLAHLSSQLWVLFPPPSHGNCLLTINEDFTWESNCSVSVDATQLWLELSKLCSPDSSRQWSASMCGPSAHTAHGLKPGPVGKGEPGDTHCLIPSPQNASK